MNQAKQITGKTNWNLINLKDLEGIIKVREHGVIKYKNPDNWKLVDYREYFNALKRHIVEMDDKGIFSVDDDSGLLHIDHCLCNLMFLSHFYRQTKDISI